MEWVQRVSQTQAGVSTLHWWLSVLFVVWFFTQVTGPHVSYHDCPSFYCLTSLSRMFAGTNTLTRLITSFSFAADCSIALLWQPVTVSWCSGAGPELLALLVVYWPLLCVSALAIRQRNTAAIISARYFTASTADGWSDFQVCRLAKTCSRHSLLTVTAWNGCWWSYTRRAWGTFLSFPFHSWGLHTMAWTQMCKQSRGCKASIF